jgi:hypothetical protein
MTKYSLVAAMGFELKSTYFFEGMQRYSFGWRNPNHAGAFLASLLPFVWWGSFLWSRLSLRILFLVLEGALSFMIGLTYSRAAILAWLISGCFFSIVCRKHVSAALERSLSLRRVLLIRMVFLCSVVCITGLGRRFATVAMGDPSAGNRIKVWEGALNLIAARPWSGWGLRNGGLAFMQWQVDPSSKEIYANVVNSYLQVGVETGVKGVCGIVFVLSIVLFSLLLSSNQPSRRMFGIASASSSSVVAFAIASFFSTLFADPSIIWLPILGVLVAAVELAQMSRLTVLSALARSLLGAITCGGMFYTLALSTADCSSVRMTALRGGAVRFCPRGHIERKNEVVFYPDERILGPYYGIALRGAMDLIDPSNSYVIVPPGATFLQSDSRPVVVFGSRVAELPGGIKSSFITAVFPVGIPPTKQECFPNLIILPDIDEIGFSFLWSKCGVASKAKIEIILGSGQDGRSKVLDILRIIFRGIKLIPH